MDACRFTGRSNMTETMLWDSIKLCTNKQTKEQKKTEQTNQFIKTSFSFFLHRAIWLNFPGFAFIQSLAMLLGIVMAAFYSACDPVTSKLVSKPDQVSFTYHLIIY